MNFPRNQCILSSFCAVTGGSFQISRPYFLNWKTTVSDDALHIVPKRRYTFSKSSTFRNSLFLLAKTWNVQGKSTLRASLTQRVGRYSFLPNLTGKLKFLTQPKRTLHFLSLLNVYSTWVSTRSPSNLRGDCRAATFTAWIPRRKGRLWRASSFNLFAAVYFPAPQS